MRDALRALVEQLVKETSSEPSMILFDGQPYKPVPTVLCDQLEAALADASSHDDHDWSPANKLPPTEVLQQIAEADGYRLVDGQPLSVPLVSAQAQQDEKNRPHGPTIQEWQRTMADHYANGWLAGKASGLSAQAGAPDLEAQGEAMREWARQIRTAESQAELLMIAADIEANAPPLAPTKETTP